jgi:hypothetical protein
MKTKSHSKESLSDAEDQNQEETFHSIDLLQDYGINASDIKKLRDSGFNSIE